MVDANVELLAIDAVSQSLAVFEWVVEGMLEKLLDRESRCY